MEGGAIQPKRRQSIRPPRMCWIAAASAATAETPIFAPAPRRARRGKHHHGKPDVAEHQADETAGERREEAPQRDRYQEEGVQALEYPR
jgi:hypothetical protein